MNIFSLERVYLFDNSDFLSSSLNLVDGKADSVQIYAAPSIRSFQIKNDLLFKGK